MTLTRTQYARQRLGIAATLAADGHALVAREHLRSAATTLDSQWVGRGDLAARVAAVSDGDVTTASARRELREVIQKIDAKLEPAVEGSPFRAASDGGGL